MSLPHNYKIYPKNVEKPEKTKINGKDFTVHGFHFCGLRDFYDFLKCDPQINYNVWSDECLASSNESCKVAGIPYDEAVEKLIQKKDPGYQEYLKIQKMIPAKKGNTNKREIRHSVSGGVIDPVAYSKGSGKIYKTSRKNKQSKYITIDTQIAYDKNHNKDQVFYRALIITNLIKALERSNYNVSVNSFMVLENKDEIIKAIFEIKKFGGDINYQALYKSLVDVEFFRRLCFRLIEISDVQRGWSFGYGSISNENTVRQLLNFENIDIYFDQPSKMGIKGIEIGEDFENTVENLNLKNFIDVETEKSILSNNIKVLKR